MKKMILLLWLMAAPLMAQHATQFAYYSTTDTFKVNAPEIIDDILVYSAMLWDSDTAVQTEGFTLESIKKAVSGAEVGQPINTGAPFDTILIHHAGWYLAKFLITGSSNDVFPIRFGLLNIDENTIIPFSVYGVDFNFSTEIAEQLAGQVVFYVPANTRIQLVNDGEITAASVNPQDNSVTSLYLFELLGR